LANQSVPGPKGTDVFDDPPPPDPFPVTGGGADPGPIGLKGGAPIVIDRKVAKVDDSDWKPPSPGTTPEIVVHGKTLADVAAALDKRDEWGRGGGMFRSVPIPPGSSPTVDVTLKANLVKILPKWPEYASASTAAKAEWDKMVAKLEVHEQRHVDIAIEEADKLAKDLVGKSVDDIASTVTAANASMKSRQDDLDAPTNTDHGAKPGVKYGDVSLDTSIT
jgi:hypothetical protein